MKTAVGYAMLSASAVDTGEGERRVSVNTREIVLAVVGVLIISLAVSLAVGGSLRQEIYGLREELVRVHDAQRVMEGMLNEMNRALLAMEEQSRWILHREWKLQGCGDEIPAILTWTFRELQAADTVKVEIRALGEEEWRSFPARETGHLTYESEVILSCQVDWEYRVVVEGADGVRASDPAILDAFAELKAQELLLYIGETVTHEGSTWISYVVQNNARDLNDCTAIEEAQLLVTLPDGAIETVSMQRGRLDDLPPGVPTSTRQEEIRLRIQADENWWSEWIELPEDRVVVLATVTLGDGVQARLDESLSWRRRR